MRFTEVQADVIEERSIPDGRLDLERRFPVDDAGLLLRSPAIIAMRIESATSACQSAIDE